MMKNLRVFLLLSVLSIGSLYAQERQVSGKVTSADDGSALPGVNVIQKGTANGTVTDSNGAYKLTLPAGGSSTLVISFIGMSTQEIDVGERSVIDINMSAAVTQLTEVFVTAQGIEKTKNELGYAAQNVKGEALTRTRDVNFINALSGKIAGVQIQKNNSMGGSTNIVVRGYKSITGNNQPLFVVDGVPIDNSNTNSSGQTQGGGGYDYGNAAADINADDIETLNVLKGAAATALYGSRAANGVIFITTKKAKKGLGVTINTGVTFGNVDKTTLPTYQKEYGAGYCKCYGTGSSQDFDRATMAGVTGDAVPTYEDASMGAKFDGRPVFQSNALDVTSPFYQKQTPWVAGANDPSTFFVTQVQTNTNIGIEGGGDKSQFKLNYTKSTDSGIMPNSSLKKDFLNFSSAWDLTSKLKASAQINFSNIAGQGRYGTGYSGQQNVMTSFRQWWEMNVDVAEQKASYDRNYALYGTPQNTTWNYTNITSNPPNKKAIYWDNVYWSRYQNYETDNRLRYFGNARLDYNLTDWLSFMGRTSIDSYSEQQDERIALGSTGVSRYSRYNRTYKEINYDFMANLKKDLNENFNLRATLGFNSRRTTINSISSATNGGMITALPYAISNSVNPPNPPTEGFSDIMVNGYYANASVGFKKFLYVDLSYRVDVSSTLPVKDHVYPYKSAAASFVFSELLGVTPWLTVGKIRGNYAEVGNSAPFNSLLDLYDKPVAWGSVPMFSIPNTKNNSALVPELTKNMEFGLEMSFFDNRVGFDATYYKSNTYNQLIPISVSTATGYSTKFINAGDVQNSGVELTLFGVPVKTPDFEWRIDVNWTRNRNIVNSLYTDASGVPLTNYQLGAFQNGVSTNAAVGQPYGALRGKDFTYTADGQRIVGTDGYYVQTTTSNNVIGNIMPNWIGGINNRFTYKNLTLSFLIDIKNGGNVWSLDQAYGQATGIYIEGAGKNDLGNPKRDPVADGGGIILPGVHADGTPNTTRIEMDYDALGYTKTPSRAFTYDASYVKLREVMLTYSLPSAVLSKLGPIKGIDISLVGRNLWIIQKFVPYSDPEDSFSSGNIQGAQIGALPNVKTTGFNVKFRF